MHYDKIIIGSGSTSTAGVHGIERLRVADASVMPLTVSAPTNLTCMMIGERIAEWMRVEPD